MTLENKLLDDMKKAMKNRDHFRLSVIRFTRSSIERYKIDNRKKELAEDEVLGIIRSEVKKRKDSVQTFKDAGRADLFEKEQNELDILMEYFPKELSRDELRKLIKEKLVQLDAKGKKDFGRVMKEIVPAFRNQADGNVIKEIVTEELGN